MKIKVKHVLISENPHVIINTAAYMTNVDVCEDEHEKCDNINVDLVKYLSEISKAKLIRILFIFLLILFLMEKMVLILKMIFQILYLIMDFLN